MSFTGSIGAATFGSSSSAASAVSGSTSMTRLPSTILTISRRARVERTSSRSWARVFLPASTSSASLMPALALPLFGAKTWAFSNSFLAVSGLFSSRALSALPMTSFRASWFCFREKPSVRSAASRAGTSGFAFHCDAMPARKKNSASAGGTLWAASALTALPDASPLTATSMFFAPAFSLPMTSVGTSRRRGGILLGRISLASADSLSVGAYSTGSAMSLSRRGRSSSTFSRRPARMHLPPVPEIRPCRFCESIFGPRGTAWKGMCFLMRASHSSLRSEASTGLATLLPSPR